MTPKRPITNRYKDTDGKEYVRASHDDFRTLPNRYRESMGRLSGFMQDEKIVNWIYYALANYDLGEYSKAHQYLVWSLKNMPALEHLIFYYFRICERVLSIPLTQEEILYERKLAKYRALPKWLRWTMPGFEFQVRCKYCGRDGRHVDPNTPTFGFDTLANSCNFCGRMYHMPSAMWDNPDGRAYSYYRMSFKDEEFYEEFEDDYSPSPRCKRRRKG